MIKKWTLLVIIANIAVSMFGQQPTDNKITSRGQHSVNKGRTKAPVNAPNNYNLTYQCCNWQINPDIKYISGSIYSEFTITANNCSSIYFDLADNMTVDSITQRKTKLEFTHANNLLIVKFPIELVAGARDSVLVYYKGEPESAEGFGAFEQGSHSGTNIIWTLSEPYGAKQWWPCKQDLIDKIDSVDIIVTAPLGNRVASNGVLQRVDSIDNSVVYHWKHRHPIAAYLVAIAVTNYAAYSDWATLSSGEKVEILNYVFPENLATAKQQTPYTATVLKFYSDKFIPYPFKSEKYGHAQFLWGGGMEHQTMSFMVSFGQSLIAHELAHQWFGDHVTCGSWSDIWINEGYATYCEGLVVEHFTSDLNFRSWKEGRINYITSVADGSVYCYDTSSVSRIFNGRLSYSKGGMVLHMLRTQIGDEAFFTGTRNLLSGVQTSGKYARTEDVQKIFETAADTTLTEFFSDWIYGEGYPTIKVEWFRGEGNTISLDISQTVSMPSVTSFFENNLEILLEGDGQSKLVTLKHCSNHQEFIIEAGFRVEKLTIDPNFNLISLHNKSVYTTARESEFNNELSISPNPVKDMLYIKTQRDFIIQKAELIDYAGKTILEMGNEKKDRKMQLNLSDVNPGNYYLRVFTNKRVFSQAIIKK